jgi:cell division protein FtsW
MTQANYAQLAIYNGGQLGQGPGGSEIRNHMAAAYNDFILPF